MWSLVCLVVFLTPMLLGSIVKIKGQLIWLFSLLALMNFMGLIPYTWTISLYPVLTLLTALVLWSVFSLMNLSVPTKHWSIRASSHYLPLTTPVFLWLILPVIEIVSQLIRPLTLTVRLTANMIAGHVLIFLVSYLGNLGFFLFLILIPFEMMVAMVQGYVFMMLLDSYAQER